MADIGMGSAATGLTAMQNLIDIISGNLANAQTVGYKSQHILFKDLFYKVSQEPGAPTSSQQTSAPSGIQYCMGVRVAEVYRSNTQGNYIDTQDVYSMCINGPGFFQIQTPKGIVYTRVGSFRLDPKNRQLVTSEGYPLIPNISIPQEARTDTLQINEDGTVVVSIDGQQAPQNLGPIEIATFPSPGSLKPLGNGYWTPADAANAPIVGLPSSVGFGSLVHKALEGSNVNPIDAITDLIKAQRGYEMNAKVLETIDQMKGVLTKT